MSKRFVLFLLSVLIATTASAAEPLHYLVAYDSALQGDWSIANWDDPDHVITVNPNAPAPGRPGNALEVRFSENGWGAFGLANMTDWNNVHYMYLNEFKTIEFELYIEPDATGMSNLYFILDDSGYSSEPQLVSFIPGWDEAHPESSAGRWIPVTIDLSQLGATVPRFMRFLFYNAGSPSRPHFRMANVRLGWTEDTTPPAFTSVTATPSLTYDRLTLAFTNDKATTYKIEYGAGNYDNVIDGDPAELRPSHSATLTGLSRGRTYQYRITAWQHQGDPSAAPTPGVHTGTYAMPAVPTAPPAVSGFDATPSEIAVGESARLTWAVTDYDTLTIDSGVGSVAQIAGTTGVLVRPAETTEYTLTATNAVGSVTRSVTVVTHAVPTINSFTASAAKITLGGASTLKWDVDGFVTISIDHGVGVVSAIAGSTGVAVSPGQTTTYELTASNAYGTVRQTATVTIAASPTNPIWVMGYYVGYQRALQQPDQVDYAAMTHIIVSAVVPRTNGTFETHFYIGDTDGPLWAKDVVRRAHAAGTKALLMVGGAGSVAGFQATSDPAVRAAFVSNLTAFVRECGFDGIDLDWEPLVPSDSDNVLALVDALQAPGALPRGSYIYTLPVGWNNANWDNMADPFYGTVATRFDRVSPMSYSMLWLGDGWDSWHSSALYGETPHAPSSIDNTIQALRRAGVPDAKIGIGIGFYGSAYENGAWQNGEFVHLDPPAIPAYVTEPHQGTSTAFSRYGDNQISYSNVMRYMHSGMSYRWDDSARVPYLSFATPTLFAVPDTANMVTTYVTYENEQSVAEKGSYVRSNNLGGVMIWTISQGYLGSWKTTGELDPLMKAVTAALRE
jgi:chitinase